MGFIDNEKLNEIDTEVMKILVEKFKLEKEEVFIWSQKFYNIVRRQLKEAKE